ncbi:MAG: hypothetical protein DRJ05_07200 [Bacteroidetes bacterium]|nr:MAG: hypothetical protein DRJ05_07200 [Bacteroidota bacterium]
MKTTIRILFLTLALIISINTWAAQVNKQDAKQLALNFFWEKSGMAIDEIKFEREIVQFKDAVPVYYIFNMDEGFVIVAADDAVFPVLAYSYEGKFTEAELPKNIRAWMKSYEGQIAFTIQQKGQASMAIKEVWDKYLSLNFSPEKETKEEVKPLLYTNWGQGCFYNTDFPEYENENLCGHTYTGCVATAMAEIIKFHNYPKQGTGSHGYNSTYGWLEADFGNTFYNWTDMQYELVDENPAVAELIYHCAVSINTIFVPGGSGAYDIDVRDALVDYFGYEDEAQFILRNNYSGDWEILLRSELDDGRPVLYGAVAEDEGDYYGHTLVCDGYQDTAFFHLNWGWEGIYNGYYYLDSLTANGYDYNLFHDVIIGIRPDIGESYSIQAPENLTAVPDGTSINLIWDEATEGTLEKLGYNVFRDGQVVNLAIVTDTVFTDTNVPSGEHSYKVSTVYIGDEALSENSVQVQGVGSPRQVTGKSPYVISPNPATGFIIVSGKLEDNNISDIKLLDLSGREIKNWDIANQNETIQLKLPEVEGLFLIQISNLNGTFTSKLIIR